MVTEDQLISRMFKCPEYYSTAAKAKNRPKRRARYRGRAPDSRHGKHLRYWSRRMTQKVALRFRKELDGRAKLRNICGIRTIPEIVPAVDLWLDCAATGLGLRTHPRQRQIEHRSTARSGPCFTRLPPWRNVRRSFLLDRSLDRKIRRARYRGLGQFIGRADFESILPGCQRSQR